MTDIVLQERTRGAGLWRRLRSADPIWLASALLLGVLVAVNPAQGADSTRFAVANLVDTAPFLVLSVGMAAYARATGADGIVAQAFKGSPYMMILLAAVAGGLSPFCSCGVIPLIAALLSMGVPLSAVMAFWLASPVMDPSMFILTVGVLGFPFAVAKTLAAVGLGLFGGFAVHVVNGIGGLGDPLREGIGNGGCGGAKVRAPKPVAWRFWQEADRIETFRRESLATTLFLAKWLLLAFILESLMLAYVPADLVSRALGGTGVGPIAVATLIGVPAYLNGYAALPLVGGLIGQGMTPGAGLAFLVAGGVTSLPAALAVFALVRVPVFALYILLALAGSFLAGLMFQLWSVL